jgi:hypothetical protein
MSLRVGFLLKKGCLAITMLLVFGTANALPLKWGRNLTEVHTFSDELILSGWQMSDYDNGLKFTGNPNSQGKKFSIGYDGTGSAYFAVFQSKQTKNGLVTKERWGEAYYNKKHKLKVHWLKKPLNLDLGNPVMAAVSENSLQAETGPAPFPSIVEIETKDNPAITLFPNPQAGESLIAINEGREPDGSAAPVPEPASMLLFGTGSVVFAGYLRRKLKK